MEKILQKFFNLLPEKMRKVVEGKTLTPVPAAPDSLGGELDVHLRKVLAAARTNPCIDAAMVERMVVVFKKLLKEYPDCADEKKTVISAAICYFIDADDAQSDFSDAFGFDDDLAVLNAALLAIGRPELLVIRPEK